MTPGIAAVLARFPQRELEIRRRIWARDSKLAEICEDYGEALAARDQWQAQGPEGAATAEDLRKILLELEAELLAHLDKVQKRPRSDE